MKNNYIRLSLIILSHNRLEFLRRCIQSIFDFVKTSCELIIIDDNSGSEVIRYLKSIKKKGYIKQIKVYYYKDGINNIARNRNKGISLFSGDFIYFIANDYQLTPGSTEVLLKSFSLSPKIGIVGPIYFSYDKKIQFCGSYLEVERPSRPNLSFSDLINMFEVDHITGMIRQEVFEQVSLYDESFSNCNEDLEFSLRVKSKGFKIFCQPRAAIYHHRDLYEDIPERNIEEALRKYRLKHNFLNFRFFRITAVPSLSKNFIELPYKHE